MDAGLMEGRPKVKPRAGGREAAGRIYAGGVEAGSLGCEATPGLRARIGFPTPGRRIRANPGLPAATHPA